MRVEISGPIGPHSNVSFAMVAHCEPAGSRSGLGSCMGDVVPASIHGSPAPFDVKINGFASSRFVEVVHCCMEPGVRQFCRHDKIC